VAHTSYLSYYGGRDQEDQGWKPAQGKKKLETLSRKKPVTHTPHTHNQVVQSAGLEFKPLYRKTNNKPTLCMASMFSLTDTI
jgi:hypothetical protein